MQAIEGTIRERLQYVKMQLSKGNAPEPAQLAALIRALVDDLRSHISSIPAEAKTMLQDGFASVGWDVTSNAPAASEPPHVQAVLQMLEGLLTRLSTRLQTQQHAQPLKAAIHCAPNSMANACAQCNARLTPGGPMQGQFDDTVGKWYCFACWAAWDAHAPLPSGTSGHSGARGPVAAVAGAAENDRAQMYQLAQQRLQGEAAAKLEADRQSHHKAELARVEMRNAEMRNEKCQLVANTGLEAAKLTQVVGEGALHLEREKLAMELESKRQEMEFKRSQVCLIVGVVV